jgi:hypothetical protein
MTILGKVPVDGGTAIPTSLPTALLLVGTGADRANNMPSVSDLIISAWLAKATEKRGPGRPKKPAPTLLTAPLKRKRGRPRRPRKPAGRQWSSNGPTKYTEEDKQLLIQRIDDRKAIAATHSRRLSDAAALREEMIDYFVSLGDSREKAMRGAMKRLPALKTALSRFRKK